MKRILMIGCMLFSISAAPVLIGQTGLPVASHPNSQKPLPFTKPLEVSWQPTRLKTEPAPRERYHWPTGVRVRITRRFDPPDQPWGSGHRGIDLAYHTGGSIYAASGGTVVFAGILVDRPVISIQNQTGLRNTYEPVNPAIEVGAQVRKGQLIGNLAPGHHPGLDALHFGVKDETGLYLNPARFLIPRIRLYPY